MTIYTFLYNDPKLSQTYRLRVAGYNSDVALKAVKKYLSKAGYNPKCISEEPTDVNRDGIIFEPSSYQFR